VILNYIAEYLVIVPGLIVDLAVLYFFAFGAWIIAGRQAYLADTEHYSRDPKNFENMIKDAARFHKIDPELKWAQVKLGLLWPMFYRLRNMWAATRWLRTLYRNFKQLLHAHDSVGRYGNFVVISFVVNIILGTITAISILAWGVLGF